MSNLTPKREAFAQNIANGMTQADAYRASFSAGKMKPETIQQAASRLMANSKVSARVAEFKKALEEKHLWTREKSVKILSQIAENKESTNSEKISSIKELNLMHGFNAPQQLNINTLNPMVIELTT
jgi:hypothetical protein